MASNSTDIIHNGFTHHVSLSDIVCETHPVPFSQVQIELTITVTINFMCFGRVPALSLPVTRQETVTFDLLTLWEGRDHVRRILAPAFASVRIDADNPWYGIMADKITRRALEISGWTLNNGFNCKVLPLDSVIETSVLVSENTLEFLMGRRALAESAAEFERNNLGMVPAQESSVKEMLTRVRVEDGGDEDCTVCLEGMEGGSYAARMPCSHMFHAECIGKWLELSHYCPVSSNNGTGDSVAVDSGGTFSLLPNGALRLINGSGSIVWDSATTNRGVSHASIDDSGNFQLLNNDGFPLWSSLENPTDTLIPSQNFTVGKILLSGSYSLSLDRSGDLNLKWNDTVEYWSLGFNSSINGNLSSPWFMLRSNGILVGLDPSFPSGMVNMAFSTDYGEGNDVFRFLRMDAVTDQCRVFGFCGDMGICSYRDSNPICGCSSQNFEPIDVNDGRKGCKRKVDLEDCPGDVSMLQLEHAEFLTYPPEVSEQTFIVGIVAFRSNCLQNGSCIASTFVADGSGFCYMKTPCFVSGNQGEVLPSTSFVKVCGQAVPKTTLYQGTSEKDNDLRLQVVDVVVIVLATLLALVAVVTVQFSYKEIQQSTKRFPEKLGEGGFGTVYKGTLPNRMVVAVKQLVGIEQGEKQFRMEVATISSTHHQNLVRLVGFFSEGRHRLLVYELLRNSSLDKFLFTPNESLNWENRFNIALGTGRGLTYLHEECRDCIIHCDIKPENILLDEVHTAKDLAKL
ncbi:hypothetical protein V6N13_065428 [Hibiscus sabdariffa]